MTRRLTRDTKNAVLGGVAAGFANYFGVDPVLVRLVFILLVVLNGFGLVAYVVGWVIMPRAESVADAAGSASPAGAAGAPSPAAAAGTSAAAGTAKTVETGRGSVVAGAVLIVLGVLFLLDRFPWWHWPLWARFSNLWPVILIAIGVSLIFKAARSRGGKAS